MYRTRQSFIGCHMIYKLKLNADHSLKKKFRIGLDGDEDSEKNNLRTDFCMFPLIDLRIIA